MTWLVLGIIAWIAIHCYLSYKGFGMGFFE